MPWTSLKRFSSLYQNLSSRSPIFNLKNPIYPLKNSTKPCNHSAKWIRTKFASGYSALSPKTLDSIIDTHRFKSLPPEEIPARWDDFHIGRGHVGAVLSTPKFKLLQQRASSCVYFVVPVRKDKGYTTMFMQCKMPNHVIFTGLDDYKARGTQASPYMTVTYFTDFAESKGLVLVRGDIVLPSKMSDEEGTALLNDAQSFYLDDSRFRIVEQFNKHTSEFEFRDVLRTLNIPAA